MEGKQMNERQQRHAETLDAIRAAVDKLVGERGFENTHIADICGEVGISVGAFYHYFATKQSVLIDRFIRRNKYYRGLYEQRLRHMEPLTALKIFLEKMFVYAHTRVHNVLLPYAQALVTEYQEWCAVDGDAVKEILETLVRAGIAQGTISARHSPEAVALCITSIYHGWMISECVDRRTQQEGKAALDVWLDWLESLRTN